MITTIESLKKAFDAILTKEILIGNDDDFRTVLEDKLDSITEFIESQSKSIPDDSLEKNEISRFTKNFNDTVENIKLTIAEYYDGRPDVAYKTFEVTLNDLFQRGILPKKLFQRTPFYRLRVFTEKPFTKREEIFHIPFRKRTLVAPQRYSIAGYPCLYLSNSVYTAWEELHRPPLDSVGFAEFVSSYSLYFVNLSLQDFKKFIQETEDCLSFFENIILYPILMICSIKVTHPTHPFKPEYIFPQLILRWCKSEDDYHGVMYDSTRIHSKSKGIFYNFVIPVGDYLRSTDFCPDLTRKLKLTIPCTIDSIDTSKPIDGEGFEDILEIFSKELYGIIPFNNSIFARIETYLQSQELRTL
jgi:hypothetical protein